MASQDHPHYVAVAGNNYSTVAASQTDQVLGATGALGDVLNGVLIIPGTTSPGAVSVKDSTTSITLFAGGSSSVADLKPFFVPLNAASKNGAWKMTTGGSVTAIAVGKFT